MGWMSNWEYAQEVPYKWRSSMTLPRELSLAELDGQFHIKQQFRLTAALVSKPISNQRWGFVVPILLELISLRSRNGRCD